MKHPVITFLLSILLCACACTAHRPYAHLEKTLAQFVSDKDATIGIAVIIDNSDTVSVNGNRQFPMLSVYKFPIALAYADFCHSTGLKLNRPIRITKEDLHLGTYSPMTEKILTSSRLSTDSISMPSIRLLEYMLQQSDNNASDIILRSIGGPAAVGSFLSLADISGINVMNYENEMHIDTSLCYSNSSSPLAMAALLDHFDRKSNDSISLEIKRIMESCQTGTERLPKPMPQANAIIGHKTGTGFTLPDGRLMAVNDAGYVHLPDGRHYSIAVFIENSALTMPDTEALIAEISQLVLTATNRRR